MSESNDYKALRMHMRKQGDRIDRIENLMVDGMPDVNFCCNGIECWIELKSPTEPKRSTTPLFGSNHKLSQDQKNWFLRQVNAKGRGWILIATDKRWMLISGKFADQVNSMTVNELIELCAWHTEKPIKDKNQWTILRIALQR